MVVESRVTPRKVKVRKPVNGESSSEDFPPSNMVGFRVTPRKVKIRHRKLVKKGKHSESSSDENTFTKKEKEKEETGIQNLPMWVEPEFLQCLEPEEVSYKVGLLRKAKVVNIRSQPQVKDCFYSRELQCVVWKGTKRSFKRYRSQGGIPNTGDMTKILVDIIARLIETADQYILSRSIYYQNKKIFKNKEQVDRILSSIVRTVGCQRHQLRIISKSKGFVLGDLKYEYNGIEVSCRTGQKLEDNIEKMKMISIGKQIKFILLVEKYTVFHELKRQSFAEKNNCLVITAQGMPDYSTRIFLAKLYGIKPIQIFGLVDFNPHGIQILSVYKYGSLNMVGENKFLSVPNIFYLGIKNDDLGKYIPLSDCTLLDAKRKQLAETLRKHVMNTEFHEDLSDMITEGLEAQIDSIFLSSNPEYICDTYLPEKLKEFYRLSDSDSDSAHGANIQSDEGSLVEDEQSQRGGVSNPNKEVEGA